MGAFFGFNPGNTSGGKTSNNAPQPVPITGTGGGGGISTGGVASPNLPFLNPPTPSANQSPFGSTSLQNLNSGLPGVSGNFNALADAYGSGTANSLISILSGGLFNPQVAASFLNAMQPGVNRGMADIQNSFGAEGSRFGSAAALGIGDYQSQVNLNEQQTLSNMFLTSQGEELNLMQNLLPTIHGERASGGILSDVLGGLEAAGGIASLFIPGLQGLAGPLIGGGIGTITGQGGSNKSPGNPTSGLPTNTPPIANVNVGNAANIDASASGGYNPNTNVANQDVLQTISAGQDLGGADPFSNGGSNVANDPSIVPFW